MRPRSAPFDLLLPAGGRVQLTVTTRRATRELRRLGDELAAMGLTEYITRATVVELKRVRVVAGLGMDTRLKTARHRRDDGGRWPQARQVSIVHTRSPGRRASRPARSAADQSIITSGDFARSGRPRRPGQRREPVRRSTPGPDHAAAPAVIPPRLMNRVLRSTLAKSRPGTGRRRGARAELQIDQPVLPRPGRRCRNWNRVYGRRAAGPCRSPGTCCVRRRKADVSRQARSSMVAGHPAPSFC